MRPVRFLFLKEISANIPAVVVVFPEVVGIFGMALIVLNFGTRRLPNHVVCAHICAQLKDRP